jgi:hypothetical protein
MSKKEGRIVATGINPQGVPWKEISFVEENKQEKTRKSSNRTKD